MIEEPRPPRLEDDEVLVETQNKAESCNVEYCVSVLLVFVAKGDGSISSEESAEMLSLVSDHFNLQNSQSLELITNADCENLLKGLAALLSTEEKEDVAVMMLKVVAADGRKDVEELETFQTAAEIIGISAETLHRAYDRYFEETRV